MYQPPREKKQTNRSKKTTAELRPAFRSLPLYMKQRSTTQDECPIHVRVQHEKHEKCLLTRS
jgi:hypothetical protein